MASRPSSLYKQHTRHSASGTELFSTAFELHAMQAAVLQPAATQW